MYQLKATCGYEIQVIEDLCLVEDHNNRTQFQGTYEQCVKWLNDRGVRMLGERRDANLIAMADKRAQTVIDATAEME
jgi:hypothetical protein